ncbi:probable receptor-like protein kinase At5g24010 [Rosa rugosa]|uniref:probable receptor-like protein kinase At5g24010 n=1 Tax=Rosa rugosa TaxID=74645 RepID=UPI002B40AF62|nr:probable receptor-like protein kinase At5g24010 [Rosa rugosa]
MEAKHNTLHFLSLTLISLLHFSASFTPSDNYLLNCGSSSNASLFNRVFVGDSTSGSGFGSRGRSISVTNNKTPPPNSPSPYNTARVFTSASSYSFSIKKIGTHLVRFHFSPFSAQGFDLRAANFTISVNLLVILTHAHVNETVIREYIMKIDTNVLEIVFSPLGNSGFGYVNAIEVFTAPGDLIVDNGAKLVSANVDEYRNLSSQVLETIYRINVGGSNLTPFNDTLWRFWVPDVEYLALESAAKRASTTDVPNYQSGGASREIAPENVYMTAQEMNNNNSTVGERFNITWKFPVALGGAAHLVRLHFCDIVSKSLNLLYFDVYINGYAAYRDVDLSVMATNELATPVYIDFVVDSDDSGLIEVSVGPSDLSSPMRINAILNGAEIMRMVNVSNLHAQIVSTVSKKKNIWIWVAPVAGGGFVVLCLAMVAVLLALKRKKKKKKKLKTRRSESVGWTPLRVYGGSSHSRMSERTALASPGANGYYCLRIPFAELQAATSNFDKKLIVGSGGFGMVYKAVLRDNTKVAVKRGVPGSRQGLPEFQTEITVLSQIRHQHLVSLVGYCEEQSEMILVYEYMEKGPLKKHLYGSGLPPLSWKQRLEICIGSARGLHYLHTGFAQGIIHRDIKSTNILLDNNYVPKVADFGLSRSGPCLDETHVSTGVKGSFGYLDPEYFRRQQLTDKSDVYSFGVVLFEVLCARPAVDPLVEREQVNLGEWAMQWQKKGMLEKIIDPHLVGHIKPKSLKKFGETAEKCLAEYGADRPTIGDVLWNLEYALQLQESRPRQELPEAGESNELPTNSIAPGDPSPSIRRSEDDGAGSSEINTSQVFSQLMNTDGR